MDPLPHGVFISYRRRRWSVARSVAQELERNGYDVFMDVEGLDNGPYDETLLAEIERRRHFVLILAPESLDRCGSPRDWLRREIEHALKIGCNVVPLFEEGFRFDVHGKDLPRSLVELPRFNGLPLSHEHFRATLDRLRTDFLIARESGGDGLDGAVAARWNQYTLSARQRFGELWERTHPKGPPLDEVLDSLRRLLPLADADPYSLVEGMLLGFDAAVTRRADLTATFGGMWSALEGVLGWLVTEVDRQPRGAGRFSGLGEILQTLALADEASRIGGLDGQTFSRAVEDVRTYRNFYVHGGNRPDAVHVGEGCRAACLTLWLALASRRERLEIRLRGVVPPYVSARGLEETPRPKSTKTPSPKTPSTKPKTQPKPAPKTKKKASTKPPALPLDAARERLAKDDFGARPDEYRARAISGIVTHLGYSQGVPVLQEAGLDRATIVRLLLLEGHPNAKGKVARAAQAEPGAKPVAAAKPAPATPMTPAPPRVDASPFRVASLPDLLIDRSLMDGRSVAEQGAVFEGVIIALSHPKAARKLHEVGFTGAEVVRGLVAHGRGSIARNAAKEFRKLGDSSGLALSPAKGSGPTKPKAKKKKSKAKPKQKQQKGAGAAAGRVAKKSAAGKPRGGLLRRLFGLD